MNFTNDGFVIMSRDEYKAMADIVAENERAGKGNKEGKAEPSALEKAELKKRIMAEPNQSIRQKLIKDNMHLFFR